MVQRKKKTASRTVTPASRKEEKKVVSLSFFQRVNEILSQPTKYFMRIQNEEQKYALWYFFIFTLFVTLPVTLYYIAFYKLSWAWFAPLVIGSVPFNMLMLFIGAGIAHLGLKVCKAQGKYSDTLKCIAYGSTPSLILSIPYYLLASFTAPFPSSATAIVSFLLLFAAGIYTLVLEVKGYALLHKISAGRAFLGAIVLPVLFITVLAFFLAFTLFFLFASSVMYTTP